MASLRRYALQACYRALLRRGSTIATRGYCSRIASPRLPSELTAFRQALAPQHTRGFASAPTEDPIKPPMEIPTLPGKYASLLFVEAAKQGILDQVEAEMKEIGEATIQSPHFANFIKDISIPKNTAVQLITDTFNKTNFSELVKTFLAGVARNGRLRELKAMADCFGEMMKAKRGHVTARVTAVMELDAEDIEFLKKNFMDQLVNPGETVFIEQKVDENILGGVIIEVRDKRLDLSIERRIREIERILLDAC